jgi:D-alanyl-D-alanine carboxypeptidase
LRYPEGKEIITGSKFIPWHFRYIGKELALAFHSEGWQTIDEFFAKPREFFDSFS